MSTLVSNTNNLVGPVFFLEALGFLEATGIGARMLGCGLAGESAECCGGAKEGGGADVFSNLAIFFVASKEARCVGAGGSGINQGLSRNVESVDAKKKPP
jgi:hypothetical protein